MTHYWRNIMAAGTLFLLIAACSAPRPRVEEPNTHYLLGLSYLREGNDTLALREFLRAVEEQPRDAEIQAALGQAYHRKKAYSEAENHYLEALRLDPGNSRVRNNLGALYLDLKAWEKARESFRVAANDLLFTEPEVALTGLGIAHFMEGNRLQAVAAYQRAIDQRPGYAQAHFRLGEVYFALDRNDLAIESLRKALSLAPDFVAAHYQLGLAYMKAQRPEEAATAFREVVRLAPDSEPGRASRQFLKLLEGPS